MKKIETSVLLVMIAAQSSSYGRELTECEAIDCAITLKQLRDEIASRKNEVNPEGPILPGLPVKNARRR